MKLSHFFLLSVSFLPFHAHAMERLDLYEVVENTYDHNVTYNHGTSNHYKEEGTFSTQAHHTQKAWTQNSLVYDKDSQKFTQEKVLKKVIPGEDGRKRLLKTTSWPYSIHTQLSMVFNGEDYGGSGSLVGPHHLLTSAHCVYDFETMMWADEIFVYPALDETIQSKRSCLKDYTMNMIHMGDKVEVPFGLINGAPL